MIGDSMYYDGLRHNRDRHNTLTDGQHLTSQHPVEQSAPRTVQSP
jgi:hypothetical protein